MKISFITPILDRRKNDLEYKQVPMAGLSPKAFLLTLCHELLDREEVFSLSHTQRNVNLGDAEGTGNTQRSLFALGPFPLFR